MPLRELGNLRASSRDCGSWGGAKDGIWEVIEGLVVMIREPVRDS